MKRVVTAFLATCAVGAASAACMEMGIVASCTDSNGNPYTVTDTGGGTSYIAGSGRNGSWSATGSQLGGVTVYSGSDGGGSWNATATQTGQSRIIHGTDSSGRSISRACFNGICN